MAALFFDAEISILTTHNAGNDGLEPAVNEALKLFNKGKFGEVLRSEAGRQFFSLLSESKDDLQNVLQSAVKTFFSDVENQEQSELQLLLVAASCLQLFVQNNWLGPLPSETMPKHCLPEHLYAGEAQVRQLLDQVETGLSVDGEPLYSLTRFPEFLYIAHFLLVQSPDIMSHLQTVHWWRLRCLCIQQKVLDEKANTIRDNIIQSIQNVLNTERLMTDDKHRSLQVQFHLEAGHISHYMFLYREAREHFNTARKLIGIDVGLTGVMGKRTRFQENDKAQLVVKVTREGEGTSLSDCQTLQQAPTILPLNLNLDDDTVLDVISFSGEKELPLAVSDLEQAVILGVMEDYRRSRASQDSLTTEEVEAYLSFVLQQMRCWSVCVSALLLRSKLQKGNSRRVDRSMRQLEELYNQTKKPEPPVQERLRLFYCVTMVPVWTVQVELSQILLSLGAVGSALEIFERLQMWEDAINCYVRMGKREKAETVIREQLEVKATPNLWCFLGDVTGVIEHYEKAWELSKHRSARAMRCIAYLYFKKEEYEKCLECFEKSLKINSLQVAVWFTYGCAAMAAKNFTLAVTAFKRCVSIDYDNFEAWNNLALAYVHLKEKKKAFSTLNDAIKCNYENWRIWENLLLVGTDCGEFGAVIRAYHRLLDLKEKWVDEQVLGILVRACTENLPDVSGEPGNKIEDELRQLFGRITAKTTDKAEVWRLYAALCKDDKDKSLQFLQKSHRCVMQTSNWEKDLAQCQQVADQSVQLADSYQEVSVGLDNSQQALQLMSSAKLMLKGVLAKIKQCHTNPVTQELDSDVARQLCTSLDERLTSVIHRIEELKGS